MNTPELHFYYFLVGFYVHFIFSFNFLEDISPFVGPLFWTSSDVCPGFLACALFFRFTCGATPADCIEVSMAAEPF